MTIADPNFRFGDVVWVPFPFVEAPRIRERPAVVVAQLRPAAEMHLLWVLMITSAANKGWAEDVSLEQRYAECGLDVPCVIRTAKVTTVEAQLARRSGALPPDLQEEVKSLLRKRLR